MVAEVEAAVIDSSRIAHKTTDLPTLTAVLPIHPNPKLTNPNKSAIMRVRFCALRA